MRTIVITGGTDGLGKGLALHHLRRGDRVVAVGSTPAKGRALLAAAAHGGAADRAAFLQADLTSVAATRELTAALLDSHPRIDALVLCANRYRILGPRHLTPEGFEHSFALAYLSRFVLSHGLRTALEAAPRPVVLNVGTPGVPLGRIHWDDLRLARRYSGTAATLQSFRANDLLGVAFAARHPHSRVRYIAYNPGVVATGMPDHLPQPLRALTKAAFRVIAAPVAKAVPPMSGLLTDPPAEPFTAFDRTRRLPLSGTAFDRDAALRLDDITRGLLDAPAGKGR
ncbi:SDR family NAD(P)-dependent oxidoreductase [Streptomonospora nanhaiensis]|uniref:SDR family NAD(P)-dependent oxidoreductase n=1 Tax=Streptomonospora nanhaiensis TaxID=1323731 RepID=UPI001C394F6B|nr:SDR family NAD(P)-dependent oxidoreductase [Streptomonospora nanhaiensis]MBV2366452.1 SDR family NAD(P)-dependent oxidoreductase [Streptomonospora nanhaiensis]